MLLNEKVQAGYDAGFWDELASEWQQTIKTGGLNVYGIGSEMISHAEMLHKDRESAQDLCRRLLDSHGYTAASEFSAGEGWWSLTLRKTGNGYDYELYVNEVTEEGVTELATEHTEAHILFSRSDQ